MPSFSTSACCAFAASAMSVDLLDLDQVGHRGEHPPDLRAILLHGDVTDALETQRTQRVPLVLGPSDAGLDLADLEPWHHACTSARALSTAAGATSSTALPRRFATCSGSSSDCRAATVACTTLIALAEPSDLARTSWMPAHSSTARADPPAITPVPGEAGRSMTTPAAFSPCTGCGMVPWTRGTLKKCFLAFSTPFAIAAGTSFALP